MPVYEYKYESCGEKFELLQGMNDTSACKNCGSKDLTKLLFAPARPVMAGGGDTGSLDLCCGMTNPCSDSKRCCGG